MKTFFFSAAQTALIAIFIFTSNLAYSQVKSTWKGGTPGMEQDWHCAKNWNNYKVPDEFSDVIIPDVSTTSLASPVIWSGKVEVNSLFIESNAMLRVEKTAQLIVFGTATGVVRENLQLKGSMLILGEAGGKTFKAAASPDKR